MKNAPRSRPIVRSRYPLTPLWPQLDDVHSSISGTRPGRQAFWSSGQTVPATGRGHVQCQEVSRLCILLRENTLQFHWKSTYIISTAVANNVKDRLYTEALSSIENVRLTLFTSFGVQPDFRISNIVREFLLVDDWPLTQCRTPPVQLHHQRRDRASSRAGAPVDPLRFSEEPSLGRRRRDKLGRPKEGSGTVH